MRHEAAGFTLVEVLVALVIASLALAVLFQAGTEGTRAAAQSARYQLALARARSRLAAIEVAAPLQDGEQQGEDGGGFHWRTRVSTIQTAPLSALGAPQAPRVALHAVEVVISWPGSGGDRQVVLRTQRTGLAPQAAP